MMASGLNPHSGIHRICCLPPVHGSCCTLARRRLTAGSSAVAQEALVYLHGARLGEHPGDGRPVTLETGRWGPYVKHGSTAASLPRVQPRPAPRSPQRKPLRRRV